jgi:cytoskeletal protein RodZ
MKKFVLIVFLFVGIKLSAQEELTEEKSSAWLKISAPVVASKTPVKKKSTASKATNKKTTSSKSTTAKTTTPAVAPKTDEFNKTNSKVKRFQKD